MPALDLSGEAELIQALGQELLKLAGQAGLGIYYYAEPSEAQVSASLLVGDDKGMAPRAVSVDLAGLTLALWRLRHAHAPQRAWVALAYLMLGQDFRLDYIERPQLAAGGDVGARAAATLARLTQA
jgi:hypothetical protein